MVRVTYDNRWRFLQKAHETPDSIAQIGVGDTVSAFLLYMPLSGESEFECGGPICIKTGSLQAYLAFSQKELAQDFCTRANIDKSVKVISAHDLGEKYPARNTDIRTVVLFSTKTDLNKYFSDPQQFKCEKYFTPLVEVRDSRVKRILRRYFS